MPPKKPSAKAVARARRKAAANEDSDNDTVESLSLSDEEVQLSGKSGQRSRRRSQPQPKSKAPTSRKRARSGETSDNHRSGTSTPSVIDVDGDDGEPSTTARKVGKRQLTLSGETAASSTVSAAKEQRTKQLVKSHDTDSHGGEIKPSRQQKKALPAVKPPSADSEQLLAERYLAEVAIPGMLAHSFLSSEEALRISVTTQGAVDESGDETRPTEQADETVATADTDASVDAVDKEKKATEATPSAEQPAWQAEVRAGLPCVSDFIFRECHAASVYAGGGLDGLVASLTMLGFFLRLFKDQGGAGVLTLACPSCRLLGVSPGDAQSLVEFLIASHRCSPYDVAAKSWAELLAALDSPAPSPSTGKRSANALSGPDTAEPIPLSERCACAETHMALLSLLNSSVSPRVPVTLAWCLPEAMDTYQELAVTLYERRRNEAATSMQLAHNKHFAQRFNRPEPTTPTPKKLSARQVKAKADSEAKEKALLHSLNTSWALDLLAQLHGEKSSFDNLVGRTVQIASATTHTLRSAKDVAIDRPHFRLSVAMKPNQHFLSNKASTLVRPLQFQVHVQSLLWLFMAMTAIAKRSAELELTPRSGKSARPSQSRLFLLEQLEDKTGAWRSERDNTQLVVPQSVVKFATTITNAGEHNKDAFESSYAAASHIFSHTLMDETSSLDIPGLIRYAASQGTLGLLDDGEDTVEALAPPELIKGTLKRHQLENVAWMLDRERNPVAEMVELPIFSPCYDGVDSTGTAALPQGQHVGSFFYCSATCEYHILRAENEANQSLFQSLRRAISGGFLSDDVGLGKTLSVLSLCAAATYLSESGSHDADSVDVSSLIPRQWTVTSKNGPTSVHRMRFKNAVPMCLRFITHLAPTALSDTAWVPKQRLGRTTLIVVPLSIVAQWIEEIERFYPSATYVLFYGTKRSQLTIEDLARADFVITTYETLSIHLRKECDGKTQMLREWLRACDRRFCDAAVTEHKWRQCRPSFLFGAAEKYAAEHLWPSAMRAPGADQGVDLFNEVTLRCSSNPLPPPADPSRGVPAPVVSNKKHLRKRVCEEEAACGGAAGISTTWSMDVVCTPQLAVLRGPGNLVLEIDPGVQTVAGGAAAVKDARARKQALSPIILDAVWNQFCTLASGYPYAPEWPWTVDGAPEKLQQWSVTAGSTPWWCSSVPILYILKLAEMHPPPVDVRRAIAAYVLLPCCARFGPAYFASMKVNHYAEEDKAEEEGHAAIRMLDILFRRVVLDECQKCGPDSLFFLLAGERRWAVSGTPINNNSAETMVAPLRFVGAASAARYLCRYSGVFGWRGTGFTHSETSYRNCKVRGALHQMALEGRPVENLVAVLAIQADAADAEETHYCMCTKCVQDTMLASVDPALRVDTRLVPSEFQIAQLTEPRNQHIQRYFGHIIVAILCRFVVRHERDEQMRRDLALVPVEHRAVVVELAPVERELYDPAARAVSDLSQRWNRQGLFGSHVGRAQLWLQNLQRMVIHPSLQLSETPHEQLAGQPAVTMADIIVRRVVMAVVAEQTSGALSDEELEKTLMSSFVTLSAADALRWAESEELRLRMGVPKANAQGRRTPASHNAVFPGETMEMLKKIAEVPPELPTCGICMDLMAEPTVLTCYHLFCKQCIIELIGSTRNSMTRNIHAKCPYCRDAGAMLNEKRVVHPQFREDGASQAQLELETAMTEDITAPSSEGAVDARPPEEQLAAKLCEVRDGSRVRGVLHLLESQVWNDLQRREDGVLIFSKFPAALARLRTALVEAGYRPHLISGGVTLTQRRKIISALCHTSGPDTAGDGSSAAAGGGGARGEKKILLLTSRAANAGLNLTFANHVVFLEPNANPALEIQAIGRAHRFGQMKQVYAYHLYAPNTVEERIYRQTREALAQAERVRQRRGGAPQQGPEEHAPPPQVNQMRSQDLLHLLTIPDQ